jgi:glutamate racemase
MISVFDSGVGGLGVLREILSLMPDARIRFVADRANAPYGVRSMEEVRALTHGHAAGMIDQGASTIVIACNTASAAALHSLRDTFPSTQFVGMEPAIKPAAAATKTGIVGVLATRATFQGKLFASLIDEYGAEIQVIPRAAPEWVELVERGEIEGVGTISAIRDHVEPLMEAGVDTIVLGCTHFPFLLKPIVEVAGSGVTIIDPARAVAARAKTVVERPEPGELDAEVSGDIEQFKRLARDLANISFPGGVLPLDQ